MKHFPPHITFKYPWRTYQKRVLTELEEHLEDDHLHVVAPPGSGKTVLGLEVMLRLNQPTLILAPTIAIRNQWVHRFCELFLQIEQEPDWISFDIRKPKFITVSTYQGLHAACSGEKELSDELDELEIEEEKQEPKAKKTELEAVIDGLVNIDLGTIIIDEAHHLKNEWWKTLTKIKSKLSPTIVGLTATPPYDVSYAEWTRYLELNGPVDTEISVPELIKEGDLCPHQDYVRLSKPSLEELVEIEDYRKRMNELFLKLSKDDLLLEHLIHSSIIINPQDHLEWIYANMQYYSAILIFLNHNEIKLAKNHFKITGNPQTAVPALNDEWLEILLDFYINHFENEENPEVVQHQKELFNILRKSGAVEWGKVNFSNDVQIEKFLTASMGKLGSIKEITQFEASILGSDLRQVILSDYIRKEYLTDTLDINKLGVVPIFESLRREFRDELKLGVLTGSLVILPQEAITKLNEEAAKCGLTTIEGKPLYYDNRYVIIEVSAALRHDLVHIITQVFQSGAITVLVGTKSLLGEGWDAPSINVLVLASFVGSFVLSNQMRGRAIRTQRANKDKTANIWHLACYDPTSETGGKDLHILRRRFKGFVGISERENRTIENRLKRLLIPRTIRNTDIDLINNHMFKSASERDKLKWQWYDAVENGTAMIEEIKIPQEQEMNYRKEKQFYFNKTIKYVLAEIGVGVSLYSQEFLKQVPRFKDLLRTNEGIYTIITIFLLGVLLFFGRSLFKAFKMYVKYRDITKDIEAIGNTVLQTLIDTNQLHSDNLKIDTSVNDYGEVFCHLEGGSTYEKSLFIQSLQEILSPVVNPRYLIIRKNLFAFIVQRDYHPVPESLNKHKKLAVNFSKNWQKIVGDCKLVFTRNPEGRATLLKARFNSLASEFQEKSERLNRWK